MACDHVRVESVIVQRSFNRQISSEHGRLSVFRLLEFVLCLHLFLFGEVGTKNETRQRFTIQYFGHGLVCLRPHLLNSSVTLVQIMRHSNVLTALTGVHVSDFRLCMQRCIVGEEHPLCLQEAPLILIVHSLESEGATLRKFCP